MKKLFTLYIIHPKYGASFKLVYAKNKQQVLDYAPTTLKKTVDSSKYTYKVEEVIDLT